MYGKNPIKTASYCAEVDPRWTYEYVPSTALSGIFCHAKDFSMSPEVDADTGETQLGSYNGLQCAQECPNVFTMFLRSLPNFGRV